MEDFVTFALIFFISWVGGSLLLGIWDARKAAKAELQDRLYRKLDEIIHRVKVEEHHGHLYWFDEDNDKFLAQGKTQDEVIAAVKKRFPDHIFFLSKHEIVSASSNWKVSNEKKISIDNLAVD